MIGAGKMGAARHSESRARAIVSRGSALLVAVFLLLAAAWAQSPPAKVVGTIKSVTGSSAVVTTDSGSEMTVTLSESARVVRTQPGQTDLKSASPIAVSEIEVGDRVFVRGQSGEGGALIASSVVVMKKGEIAERQQQERDEWRKGVGGIVKSVDVDGGTIMLTSSPLSTAKPIAIRISASTSFRRYLPDSAKYENARPGRFDEIKPGDRIQARGTKNPDGVEFNVQEIVSGAFRGVTGTVVSTNAADGNITVMDLATKKPITVKVSADSQLRKLLPNVAMGFAMRLKGGTPGAPGTASPQGANNSPAAGSNWSGGQGQGQGSWRGAGNASGVPGVPGGPGGREGGAPPDLQQMLSHMPAVAISELNKGDAVVLVATEGSATSAPTITNLLAGVEPILTAAPGTHASTILSPWNLGAPAGAGADTAGQ